MKSEWIFRNKLEAKVELDQGPIIVEKHKKAYLCLMNYYLG